MTRRTARPLLPLLALAAATSLAGCGLLSSSDEQEPAAAATAPAPDESGTSSAASPPSPSSSPSERSPSSVPSVPPAPASEPTAASSPSTAVSEPPSSTPSAVPPARTSRPPAGGPLLPAAQLPGFNNEFFWSSGPTVASEPPDLAGTCHRVPLTSIGATGVTYRSYRPPRNSDTTAAETVARFADRKSAWRAYQVLLAWHDRCADRLTSYPRADVGPVQQVRVDAGVRAAGWYLLSYGPIGDDPDVGAYDAQGLVLGNKQVAVLSMVLYGQDYDYAAGQEPMVEAVRRAAARLG